MFTYTSCRFVTIDLYCLVFTRGAHSYGRMAIVSGLHRNRRQFIRVERDIFTHGFSTSIYRFRSIVQSVIALCAWANRNIKHLNEIITNGDFVELAILESSTRRRRTNYYGFMILRRENFNIIVYTGWHYFVIVRRRLRFTNATRDISIDRACISVRSVWYSARTTYVIERRVGQSRAVDCVRWKRRGKVTLRRDARISAPGLYRVTRATRRLRNNDNGHRRRSLPAACALRTYSGTPLSDLHACRTTSNAHRIRYASPPPEG